MFREPRRSVRAQFLDSGSQFSTMWVGNELSWIYMVFS